MARKAYELTLEGRTYRLRLTAGGQRRLRERFEEEALQAVLSAPGDLERLCALLGEALDWDGSGNAVTDGAAFYDLLVDAGYAGQERFASLACEIARVSGLMDAETAGQVARFTRQALREAYRHLDALAQEPAPAGPETAEETENPTTA